MNPNKWVLGALLVSAAPAIPQAVPGNIFVVINNTRQSQTCSIKSAGKNWSPWFNLDRAANLQQPRSVDTLQIQCRPPVRQVRYTLHPGTRYSLLRAADGKVDLREVTIPGSPAR